MKQYTHAWLCLRAMKFLEDYHAKLPVEIQSFNEEFLDFIKEFPSTFVRGAWYPDSVISDNLQGGHTWKYKFDPNPNGRKNSYRTVDCNLCKTHITQAELDKPLILETNISALPDRCEALSQAIRDMVTITNSLRKGDVLLYNDSQIAIFFLMLAHYTADSHMPLHCDARDFNTPSTVHDDMEGIWEKEILRYFSASKKRRQFDLDQDNNLHSTNTSGYANSFLSGIDNYLAAVNIPNKPIQPNKKNWDLLLGSTNKNLWDYLVGVCHISFLTSYQLLPDNGLYDYNIIRIENTPALFDGIKQRSAEILTDAIVSIAIVWLTSWIRWKLFK